MYTLRFPFRVPPNSRIGPDEVSKLAGPFELSLKEVENNLYVLKVSGLPSEEEARAFITSIRSGLAWFLLKLTVYTDAEFELQTTYYAPDPEQAASNLSKNLGVHIEGPVDGTIVELHPAVYPTGKRIQVFSGSSFTISHHYPLQTVLDLLTEGAMFPASQAFAEDRKLMVALDLYGANYTEKSSNARFLSLIMALETLAVDVDRTPLVLELLEQWNKQVEELMKKVHPESDDAQSLEAISRQLFDKRVDSKRRKIRNLVLFTLQAVPGVDANALARKATKVYDLRSKLVHEGSLDPKVLGRAIEDARDIVHQVLMTRFQNVTKGVSIRKAKGSG